MLNGNDEVEKKALVRVLVFLACCHTIVIDAKKGSYNAASPDELALVNFAKQKGYEFKERDANDNCIISNKSKGIDEKYKLLNVCEFNSTRKRMSCIFECPDGKIVLMCKGADSIIKELLSEESVNGPVY